MPKIPLYERQKSMPGKAGNAKADPHMFDEQFKAMANFGKAAAGLGRQLVQKLDEARKVSELTNAETSANEEIKNYVEGLGDRQSKDYGTLMDDYQKITEEIYKKHASKIKTPEAQKLFKEMFEQKKALYGAQVNDLSRMMEITHAQESVSNAVNSSIKAGDTSALEQFIPMFVESGVVSKEEGEELLEDAKHRINRNMIKETARAMGKDGIRWLRGEKIEAGAERYFKPPEGLEKEELEKMAEKLELDLKLKEVKEKISLEAERRKWRDEAIKKFANDELTYLDIENSPIEKDEKELWFLRHSEKLEELYTEGKSFDRTDHSLLGNLVKKIFSEPDGITEREIENLAGEGLSINDMVMLRKILRAITSDNNFFSKARLMKRFVENLSNPEAGNDPERVGEIMKAVLIFNDTHPEAPEDKLINYMNQFSDERGAVKGEKKPVRSFEEEEEKQNKDGEVKLPDSLDSGKTTEMEKGKDEAKLVRNKGYSPWEGIEPPAIPAYHREANERVLAAIRSGWQQSIIGLMERQELPETFEPANIGERIVRQMATMGGDFPAFVIGAFIGGGPASPVTATAGAFGFTAGIRKVLMDKYSKGEAKSFNEFWDRIKGAVGETIEGEITGAATGAAGKFVSKPLKNPTEIGTLTTIGAALDGRVPEPEEFIDAAILLGGFKGASKLTGKLSDIYIKTGKKPSNVVSDIFEKVSGKELEIILSNEKLLLKYLEESNVKSEPKKAITNLQKEAIKLQKIAEKKQPILNKMGDAAADKLGLEYAGNVKKVSSLMLKVLRKNNPEFNVFSPYDHTRGAIILKDFSQLAEVVKELSSQGKFEGFAAIDKPINVFGYRGIFVATELGESINGEIQIHTKASWALKQKTDKIYQKWRSSERGGELNIPKAKQAEHKRDIAESEKLWIDFWDKIPQETKDLINSTISDLNKR